MNRAIRNIGDLVYDFMEVIYEVTGFVGIAYVGGKDPDDKGTITCKL